MIIAILTIAALAATWVVFGPRAVIGIIVIPPLMFAAIVAVFVIHDANSPTRLADQIFQTSR